MQPRQEQQEQQLAIEKELGLLNTMQSYYDELTLAHSGELNFYCLTTQDMKPVIEELQPKLRCILNVQQLQQSPDGFPLKHRVFVLGNVSPDIILEFLNYGEVVNSPKLSAKVDIKLILNTDGYPININYHPNVESRIFRVLTDESKHLFPANAYILMNSRENSIISYIGKNYLKVFPTVVLTKETSAATIKGLPETITAISLFNMSAEQVKCIPSHIKTIRMGCHAPIESIQAIPSTINEVYTFNITPEQAAKIPNHVDRIIICKATLPDAVAAIPIIQGKTIGILDAMLESAANIPVHIHQVVILWGAKPESIKKIPQHISQVIIREITSVACISVIPQTVRRVILLNVNIDQVRAIPGYIQQIDLMRQMLPGVVREILPADSGIERMIHIQNAISAIVTEIPEHIKIILINQHAYAESVIAIPDTVKLICIGDDLPYTLCQSIIRLLNERKLLGFQFSESPQILLQKPDLGPAIMFLGGILAPTQSFNPTSKAFLSSLALLLNIPIAVNNLSRLHQCIKDESQPKVDLHPQHVSMAALPYLIAKVLLCASHDDHSTLKLCVNLLSSQQKRVLSEVCERYRFLLAPARSVKTSLQRGTDQLTHLIVTPLLRNTQIEQDIDFSEVSNISQEERELLTFFLEFFKDNPYFYCLTTKSIATILSNEYPSLKCIFSIRDLARNLDKDFAEVRVFVLGNVSEPVILSFLDFKEIMQATANVKLILGLGEYPSYISYHEKKKFHIIRVLTDKSSSVDPANSYIIFKSCPEELIPYLGVKHAKGNSFSVVLAPEVSVNIIKILPQGARIHVYKLTPEQVKNIPSHVQLITLHGETLPEAIAAIPTTVLRIRFVGSFNRIKAMNVPEHVRQFWLDEKMSPEAMAGLPILNPEELKTICINNAKPEAVREILGGVIVIEKNTRLDSIEAISQGVKIIEVKDVSVGQIQKIPKHIEVITLSASTPPESVAAIPQTSASAVIYLRNAELCAIAKIPAHITQICIDKHTLPKVLMAIPKTIRKVRVFLSEGAGAPLDASYKWYKLGQSIIQLLNKREEIVFCLGSEQNSLKKIEEEYLCSLARDSVAIRQVMCIILAFLTEKNHEAEARDHIHDFFREYPTIVKQNLILLKACIDPKDNDDLGFTRLSLTTGTSSNEKQTSGSSKQGSSRVIGNKELAYLLTVILPYPDPSRVTIPQYVNLLNEQQKACLLNLCNEFALVNNERHAPMNTVVMSETTTTTAVTSSTTATTTTTGTSSTTATTSAKLSPTIWRKVVAENLGIIENTTASLPVPPTTPPAKFNPVLEPISDADADDMPPPPPPPLPPPHMLNLFPGLRQLQPAPPTLPATNAMQGMALNNGGQRTALSASMGEVASILENMDVVEEQLAQRPATSQQQPSSSSFGSN